MEKTAGPGRRRDQAGASYLERSSGVSCQQDDGLASGGKVRGQQPTLETERLRLRPFFAEDAEPVQRLASESQILDTALSIPNPFSLAAAKAWIAGQVYSFRRGTSFHFAIELPESDELIGAIELGEIDSEHAQAELSLWVGVPWWGCGYGTEAAREIVRFGFESLSLNRVYAQSLARNPASARLLKRLRMKKEGLLRQRVRRGDVYEDVVLHAVLRDDLAAKRRPAKRQPDQPEPSRQPEPQS